MQRVEKVLSFVVTVVRKVRILGLSHYMTPYINLRAGTIIIKMGTTNILEEHADSVFRATVGFRNIYLKLSKT
jgi:hypothetical protein